MRATHLPISSDSAALSRYLAQAYAAPMLTAQEERMYAQAFQNHQDADAARALVMSHVRFVVHIAKKYQSFGVQLADLIQEGTVGLMKAIHRFDSTMGVRLASFAVHWIKSAIHEYVLKNWRLVKIATTKAQRKLFFNLHRFLKEVHALSEDEVDFVADALAVPENEVRLMEMRMRAGADVSVSITPDDEVVSQPVLSLVAAQQHEPEAQVIAADFLNRRDAALNYALSQLDARSQDIIEQRWLVDDKMKLQDLAKRYAVSSERIRQIEKLALKKLQAYLSGSAGWLRDQRYLETSDKNN